MQETLDQQLLERIRLTDYEAFEELHRRYYDSLFRTASKKIGSYDEAYDLLQEFFTELWEKRAQFVVTNSLDAYMRNRLWFKLSTYFRSKGFQDKHFRKFAEYLQTTEKEAVDEMEVREINLQYEELMERINKAIEEMPPKMKEVFLLSREQQLTAPSIAEKLQISTKTVNNQLHIAMNRIRAAVADPSVTALELAILVLFTKN